MKASVNHIQLNVSNTKSLLFYKKLFEYLEYKVIDQSNEHIAFSNGNTDFWIIKAEKKGVFHRKRPGLNHIAFKVSSRKNVDKFSREFLEKNKIPTLYGGPKLYPNYSKNYYAVYFEDPDRIKLEVANLLN